MFTVAHTLRATEPVARLRRALPEARLLYTSLESTRRLMLEGPPDVVVLDDESLSPSGVARLARTTASRPWLIVLAVLPPGASLWRRAFELGHAGVHELLVAGTEDHPASIRAALARAARRAVAGTVEYACHPLPTPLARPSLERVLERIGQIKRPAHLAAELEVPLVRLRRELQANSLFPPRSLLARFRILVAAEQLGHGTESVERIGLSLDYGSGPTFHKACHTMLGATPNEVRQRGGLRFACQRLCDEVRERRAAGAA